MRGRASAALLLALIGCGRIGYDSVGDDVPLDADVDVPDDPGVLAECNTPVQLLELPVPAGKTVTALELAATASGFVVVWPIEDAIYASGLDVDATHHVRVNQSGGLVTDYGTEDVAIGSNGNLAVLAVDNVGANAIWFYPLAETGYSRGATKVVDGVRARGNDFLVADPDEQLFGVAGSDGTNTVALEREIDSHPQTDPVTALAAIAPETTGIARLGDGYVVISGRPEQCDIIAVDDLVQPIGTAQVMDMTCHNAQIVNPTGDHVVAGWNCEDDQVWITGGSMAAGLPPHRSLYGDATNSASNPRLAATSAGVWYGFQVAGGRLGRALVDIDGANVASIIPDVVVAGGVVDFDLVSRDDQAFLFWTQAGALTTELWTMRLCAP